MAGGMMVSLGIYGLWADYINADPRPSHALRPQR
jgi:hypothetical protein